MINDIMLVTHLREQYLCCHEYECGRVVWVLYNTLLQHLLCLFCLSLPPQQCCLHYLCFQGQVREVLFQCFQVTLAHFLLGDTNSLVNTLNSPLGYIFHSQHRLHNHMCRPVDNENHMFTLSLCISGYANTPTGSDNRHETSQLTLCFHRLSPLHTTIISVTQNSLQFTLLSYTLYPHAQSCSPG